ncbi:MAG: MBL fold metallo-hydrolase, partial [Candidatus Hodarchaeales archaeon]
NGLGAFKDVTLVTSQKAIKNMPKSVKLTNIRVEAFDKSFIIKNRDLNVEFHHMGGHTIGSSVAYFPHEKILFGGDLFFSGGANFNIPFLSFYQNAGRKTGNPDEYIAAFEKFSDMDLEAIVPGHGTVVFNPEDELNTLLAFFKSLRSFFMTAIDEKKELKSIELPKLELIDCAFTRIEGLPTNKQRNAKRWLDNYLKHLKTSFYNHYSSKSNLQPHKSDQNANYE